MQLSNNDKRVQKFLFLKKMKQLVNLRDKTVTKSRAYSNLYVSELLLENLVNWYRDMSIDTSIPRTQFTVFFYNCLQICYKHTYP